MQALVPIVLIAFPLVVVLLRVVLPPGRAALASTVLAWLFLPVATIDIPGMPNYGKPTALAIGLLAVLAFFDCGRVLALRPRLADWFVAAWCIGPMFTTLDNGLGFKNGVAPCVDHFVALGVPYLAGRAYFRDAAGVRAVAMAIIIAGLIYVPLCLIEVRLSPQLHRWVYGYHHHEFVQTRRWGGWRPTVFVEHGLIVGLIMGFASLMATWLWRSRAVRAVWGVPASVATGALLVTFVLCKSLGAMVLYVMGVGALLTARATRWRWVVVALALIAPGYIAVRLSGEWGGDSAVAAAAMISAERAGSLKFRFDAEKLLIERALGRPLLGWDGYGRHRVVDAEGRDLAVTDGMWILALGMYGAVGLAGLFGSYLIAAVRGMTHAPVSRWNEPGAASAAGLGVMLALFAVDSLLNAASSPLFNLVIGCLAGLPRIPGRSPVPPVPRHPSAPPAGRTAPLR